MKSLSISSHFLKRAEKRCLNAHCCVITQDFSSNVHCILTQGFSSLFVFAGDGKPTSTGKLSGKLRVFGFWNCFFSVSIQLNMLRLAATRNTSAVDHIFAICQVDPAPSPDASLGANWLIWPLVASRSTIVGIIPPFPSPFSATSNSPTLPFQVQGDRSGVEYQVSKPSTLRVVGNEAKRNKYCALCDNVVSPPV